jgi:DNA polymerase I-like protein with 3'-5' exonuclease and polymerase domains
MIVGRGQFDGVLAYLKDRPKLALDTETSGLRPYHGDRLFSIILCDGENAYYFNFQAYAEIDPEQVLLSPHLDRLHEELFSDASKQWFLHNAKYDMGILAQEGIFLTGQVHCTKAIALIEYNEHFDYSLGACGARIGCKKDDAVDEYIKAHKLTEKRAGATQDYTHKFFDRVPFDIIAPYGLQDSVVGYRLGEHQETTLQRLADATPKNLPNLRAVLENEKRLTATVFRMEYTGVRIGPIVLCAGRTLRS